VRIHHGDALEVLRRIPDGSLSFLYLLHPDPWPKARHAKRRMMNDGPIELFAAKLRPGGEFRFGHDHPIYLRHALMVMRRHTDKFEWLAQTPRDFRSVPAAGRKPAMKPRRGRRGTRSGTSASGAAPIDRLTFR
jgi:tRNA (guanine-N7-)-methyltransferase